MVLVVDELKQRRAEIGAEINDLRKQISTLEQQRAAFDVVIRSYEPDYEAAPATKLRKRGGSAAVSTLFKDFDRRGFTLRTLREAGKPISTAECAQAFAREIGLDQDDPRMGQISNRFSQVLDQLAKTKRVRRAGMVDGHQHLWEVAA